MITLCWCGEELTAYRVFENTDDDEGGYNVMHVADFAGPDVYAASRYDAPCYLAGQQPEHDVLLPGGVLAMAGACRERVQS